MRIPNRPAVAAAVALVSVLSLAACGTGTGGGDPAADASGKVEGSITFQTWNLKASFGDYFNGLIADFEKQHPDVDVKWVDQPAEGYADKLSADGASGTLPDVVNVTPDLVHPLARAGLALDVGKAAGQYEKEYLSGAWKGFELPGVEGVYAFPWYLNTGPTYYNEKLFAQAGLDAGKPPKSYDELFGAALTMAEKTDGRIAMLAGAPKLEDFGRYGVRLMNEEGTSFTFNEAKGVELVQRYKELYDAKALDAQALTSSPEKTLHKFLTGAVAMNPGSAYDLENFRKQAPGLYQNLGITEAVTNTGHNQMYLQGLMVNSQSRQKPAAVQFAHFITNAENQMSFAKQVTIFPSTRGSLDDPYFSKDDGTLGTQVRIASAKSLKNAVNYVPAVYSEQMKAVLDVAVAKALQGKQSPKDALDDAVEECDKLLRQG
ncbi:ABC transporter substrate-binding protein [Streptomyces sp. NBC_00259]|uniref:ABC transporter substrate-binding protein n=1 Tax=Streptomyces sp. NBC_00259 TaxID=2903643 RepID=UPI002E28D6E4|nr:sugar ABC transporter substrate-binding protein [Streptomyces sp. NBC_00259]